MKLGEAKIELLQIRTDISRYQLELVTAKIEIVYNFISIISDLLKKEQLLKNKLYLTEEKTNIGGSSLRSISQALKMVEEKIIILEILLFRNDLSDEQVTSIKNQLEHCQETQNTLKENLQKCDWEVNLFEE